MRVTPSDERDARWERDDARYRLYVFRGPQGDTHTFDLEAATLTDALEHARIASEDDRSLWALALVVDADAGRGLVWLSGGDLHEVPATAAARARRREMQDRYLAACARRDDPVVLPDGRRLIRMFPEWGGGPLWERFTAHYPLDPATLDLPDGLGAALHAWNAEWGARGVDEPLADPDTWRRRGETLADALERALAGVAEVRREFLDRG